MRGERNMTCAERRRPSPPTHPPAHPAAYIYLFYFGSLLLEREKWEISSVGGRVRRPRNGSFSHLIMRGRGRACVGRRPRGRRARAPGWPGGGRTRTNNIYNEFFLTVAFHWFWGRARERGGDSPCGPSAPAPPAPRSAPPRRRGDCEEPFFFSSPSGSFSRMMWARAGANSRARRGGGHPPWRSYVMRKIIFSTISHKRWSGNGADFN